MCSKVDNLHLVFRESLGTDIIYARQHACGNAVFQVFRCFGCGAGSALNMDLRSQTT